MNYGEFQRFLREDCMYETIYKDTEGRPILVITELDAFVMMGKAVKEEREACAKIADGQLLNTNALLVYPIQSSAAYEIGCAIRAREKNNG